MVFITQIYTNELTLVFLMTRTLVLNLVDIVEIVWSASLPTVQYIHFYNWQCYLYILVFKQNTKLQTQNNNLTFLFTYEINGDIITEFPTTL